MLWTLIRLPIKIHTLSVSMKGLKNSVGRALTLAKKPTKLFLPRYPSLDVEIPKEVTTFGTEVRVHVYLTCHETWEFVGSSRY